MKKQIMNSVLAAIFTLVIFGGFSAVSAQSGSTDRDSPRHVTSRTITASVTRSLGDGEDVYYSIDAQKGYMTVDLTAIARDGMNFSLFIEGNGVYESMGMISGGSDTMKDSVKFKVPSRQTILIIVRYSGTARYTVRFSGSALTAAGR